MEGEAESLELEVKFGKHKGRWEVRLEELCLILRSLKTGETYEINRLEARDKVKVAGLFGKTRFLNVEKPINEVFEIQAGQAELLNKWLGPFTIKSLKASLQVRMGWSFLLGLVFVILSLPIKQQPDSIFMGIPFGWTGFTLGLLLIGVGVVMHLWPCRELFLVNSGWYLLGSIKILYHIIKGLSWWSWLFLLACIIFVLDGIAQYKRFERLEGENVIPKREKVKLFKSLYGKCQYKQKNPLRVVFVLLVLAGLLSVISLLRILLSSGISYFITTKPSIIVLLLIVLLFVFCYFTKSILAIWVAASFFPVVTYYTYVMDSPGMQGWIALGFCNLVAFSYLASKSEDYKNFIKQGISSNEKDGDAITEMNNLKDKKTESFSYLALAAVGLIAFTIYRLYQVSQLPEGFHGVFQTELRSIMALISMAAFLFFYYKKSMISWWIILFMGPLHSICNYLQHPFEWKPFLFSSIVWILVCVFFLIRKYEDYKSWMKRE